MLASEGVKLELELAEAGLYPNATKLSILFHVKPTCSHLTWKSDFQLSPVCAALRQARANDDQEPLLHYG